ncbi:hypothetical protein IVB30_11240 [Bradyrhizobium sp. 200]|uniref:hypothetical protein n=1 Tax=Bradyrhizobium sp. 200 TaxID=2782665 RepID=UPI001FFF2527|nr:hypothetical protein [Bradyrhizobium sp. 200]UPJ51862.1 hypothetical protein IVB30_11240 [Bradyrhizobium sp. 200]
MRKLLRVRNVFLGLTVLLLMLCVGLVTEFAYRMNSCGLGDHVIQSEADAIEVAKRKIVKDLRFSSSRFGSAPDFVDDLSETENCCSAVKTRNYSFVVVWEVRLFAQTAVRPNPRVAIVMLSNCGSYIFADSAIDAD